MTRALLFLLVFLSAACPAWAKGDPKSCILTVVEVQIKTTSGEWISVFKGKKEFDVVQEEAGVTVDNKDGQVPEGTYENVKLIFSETIRFTGRDGEHRTKAGGVILLKGEAREARDVDQADITEIQVSKPVWTEEGEEGEVSETLDFDYADNDKVMEVFSRRPFLKTLTVKKNSVIRVGLNVDFRGRLMFAWKNFFTGFESPEIVYLLPPTEVAELWMKIDGVTALSTKETIEWTF